MIMGYKTRPENKTVMIVLRSAKECGSADYGWLQARYTFSFGHYFDPRLLGYAALRVLNQEVLAPGACFQPRRYPSVDVLNIILQGSAEYRDSEGNSVSVSAGEALLISAQPGINWSEHNSDHTLPLTRMQLWLDACPERENPLIQRLTFPPNQRISLLASPEGGSQSLQLRQQIWIHHIRLRAGETLTTEVRAAHAYLQLMHGALQVANAGGTPQALLCGDGAFLQQEKQLTLTAKTASQALLIELPRSLSSAQA